jgi:hypothetical protein
LLQRFATVFSTRHEEPVFPRQKNQIEILKMRESIVAASCSSVSRRLPCKAIRRFRLRPAVQGSFVVLVIALGSLAKPGVASAEQSVTLAWNPSADASVVGYHIQAREENSAPTTINVGGRTQATVPGLKEGLRYTFTVTSYNEAGLESMPSNPAEFVVPVPLLLRPGATADALKRLQFPMAPGHWYELQASSDLRTWITIWQTGTASEYTWVEYEDPRSGPEGTKEFGSPGTSGRFYRLVVH